MRGPVPEAVYSKREHKGMNQSGVRTTAPGEAILGGIKLENVDTMADSIAPRVCDDGGKELSFRPNLQPQSNRLCFFTETSLSPS